MNCYSKPLNYWKILMVIFVVTFVLWSYWLLRNPYADNNIYGANKSSSNNISSGLKYNGTSFQHIVHNHSTVNSSYPQFEDSEKGIRIYGRIQKDSDYAVFSSTMHSHESLNYLFDLPLAALAWERIGFKSIVILVLDSMKIISNQKVKFVLSTLLQLKSVVMILESHHKFAVMTSQVSRLFIPYLLDSSCIDAEASWEETYLVTSDADLWPLYRDAYLLSDNNTDILCLNAFCCGDFQHNGKSYTMIPIGSIGMKVKTWRSVVRRRGFVPLNVNEIITYFSREFGTVATSDIQKGENVGWFMDQHMITILIADWAKRDNNAARVKYVQRDVSRDRIDRSSWRPYSLDGKTDAHILESAYEFKTWHRLEALLVLMYDKQLFNWCTQYARTFTQLQ